MATLKAQRRQENMFDLHNLSLAELRSLEAEIKSKIDERQEPNPLQMGMKELEEIYVI